MATEDGGRRVEDVGATSSRGWRLRFGDGVGINRARALALSKPIAFEASTGSTCTYVSRAEASANLPLVDDAAEWTVWSALCTVPTVDCGAVAHHYSTVPLAARGLGLWGRRETPTRAGAPSCPYLIGQRLLTVRWTYQDSHLANHVIPAVDYTPYAMDS